MEVKTKRLRIVSLELSQLEMYCESREKCEKAMGLTLSGVTEDSDTLSAYREMQKLVKEHPSEAVWYTNWVIILKEENKIIGGVGFKGPMNNMLEVEIGYGIDEAYRRKGYGAEAVARLTEWALSQKGVCYVTAQTEPENTASQKLLSKCNFKRIGDAEEGHLYRRERERPIFVAYLSTIGMTLGVLTGILLHKLFICLTVFILLGAIIGVAIDYTLISKRKEKGRPVTYKED